MDELAQYRQIIKNFLTHLAQFQPAHGDVEVNVVVDEQHDSYLLIDAGWHKQQRIYGNVVHLDIRNGKVWLQHNATELDVAQELIEAGIPRDRIVVGFHPPHERQYTGYAVA